MPIYEYRCTSCEQVHEFLQSINDDPVSKCPECDGVLEKLFSAPAFQFKGSGWYVTDYADKKEAKSKSDSSEPSSDGAKSGDGKGASSDSSKSSSDPESKSTSKASISSSSD